MTIINSLRIMLAMDRKRQFTSLEQINQQLLEEAEFRPIAPSRARRHQVRRFVNWLNERNIVWHKVDTSTIRKYEVYLLEEHSLTLASIRAHTSTVRTLLAERGVKIAMPGTIEDRLLGHYIDYEPDEYSPPMSRLTWNMVQTLLQGPDRNTLRGKRDSALFTVMLGTGIRGSEVPRLAVTDIQGRLSEGTRVIRIPTSTGQTDREVPLLEWTDPFGGDYLQEWLDAAGIVEGPVFRGFYKGEKRIRPGKIGVRTVEYILSQYPIILNQDGDYATFSPFALRRTYAAEAYRTRMNIRTLQKYLGLASADAVLDYIGEDLLAPDVENTLDNFGEAVDDSSFDW